MQFPYGPFAPDAKETAGGILMVADGIIPLVEGYGPAPALATPLSATALPGTPRGVISMFQGDGTNVVFGFTDTTAYQLNSAYGWTSVGGPFTAPPVGNDWSLTQFGNKLLATNVNHGLTQYDIEIPAGFASIASAGNPREVFVCANYVVALDCEDDAGNRDNRLIRTSVLGNQNDFTGTGSDYQQVEDGGRLIGGLDLKNNAALIFQDNAIRLLQFGGTSTGAFSLLKVSDGRGSVGRRSITGLDGVCYWLSTDGFKAYAGGGIEHIGAGLVDDWFLSRVDVSNLSKVQASLDPVNKIVVWRYQSLSNTSETVFTDIIGYSWQFRKWFTWTVDTMFLTQIATPGITLDAMGTDYGPLDDIDIPLDSRFWQGGQPVFAALNSLGQYATFTGGNLAAVFETGTSNSPFAGTINRATPIDDAVGGTLQIGVKDQLSDPLEWKDGDEKTSSGYVNVRGTGQNLAWRRNIPENTPWSYAKGVDNIVAVLSTGSR